MPAPPEQTLSAAALLDAATICRDRSPAEAAVYLTALNLSDRSFEDCAALPLGARDRTLTGMRAALFGSALSLRATCPACAAPLDVELNSDDLAFDDGAGAATVELGGMRYAVRPANSADLAVLAGIADTGAARTALARRCLVPLDGQPVPATLDPSATDAVGAALAAVDPGADPYVALRCFACGEAWDAPVDIARVLAADVVASADGLIDDVHDLALAYHWSEDAILALAPDRRQAYLQRLRG